MADIGECVKTIANDKDSDVFLYSGWINQENTDLLISICRQIPNRRKNAVLILTTSGGSPEHGYRLVRFLKKKYSEFSLFVFGDCKSAGTLVALGADEIIMSDFGEFGPLDVQLNKEDELISTSGLNHFQSLTILQEQAYSMFESSFNKLKKKYYITTKTASEISTSLAVGILSPISGQIDPIKLGEVQRSIKIAQDYGARLTDNKEEKMRIVQRLIGSYPSHAFVIDFKEAKALFGDTIIKEPNENEIQLEQLLFNLVREQFDNGAVLKLSIDQVFSPPITPAPPAGVAVELRTEPTTQNNNENENRIEADSVVTH